MRTVSPSTLGMPAGSAALQSRSSFGLAHPMSGSGEPRSRPLKGFTVFGRLQPFFRPLQINGENGRKRILTDSGDATRLGQGAALVALGRGASPAGRDLEGDRRQRLGGMR